MTERALHARFDRAMTANPMRLISADLLQSDLMHSTHPYFVDITNEGAAMAALASHCNLYSVSMPTR